MRHVLLPSAIAAGTRGMGQATAAARRVALAGRTLRVAPASRVAAMIRATIFLAGYLGATLQLAHAFGNDLRGFHRGLAQLRILDDLALDSLTLALQMNAQPLQLVNQPVDLLEGVAFDLPHHPIAPPRSYLPTPLLF